MIESCSIVGCGTLGASLAIELAKTKTLSTLKLIDHDCVTGPSYPFKDYELHCPKVDVVRFLCLLENNYMQIEAVQDRVVDNELLDGYFVIDCRDRKDKNIKSNIRLSMDGSFLVIDARKDYELSDDHRYVVGRDVAYIPKAMEKIISFLKNHDYMHESMQIMDLSSE